MTASRWIALIPCALLACRDGTAVSPEPPDLVRAVRSPDDALAAPADAALAPDDATAAAAPAPADATTPAAIPAVAARTFGKPTSCKAAVAAVTAGNAAYDKAVASSGFTPVPLQLLPTGTAVAARGARNAAEAEMARARAAQAVFANRASGDIVTYTLGKTTYRGLYLGGDRPSKFSVGRKGDLIFVLVPHGVHVARCDNPDIVGSTCGTPPSSAVLDVPAGVSFGGFVAIDAEMFELDPTGGKQSACPA